VPLADASGSLSELLDSVTSGPVLPLTTPTPVDNRHGRRTPAHRTPAHRAPPSLHACPHRTGPRRPPRDTREVRPDRARVQRNAGSPPS
jgi:hypothetical protein